MPPNVHNSWATNDLETQANILAYDQIRQFEEAEDFGILLKTIAGRPSL